MLSFNTARLRKRASLTVGTVAVAIGALSVACSSTGTTAPTATTTITTTTTTTTSAAASAGGAAVATTKSMVQRAVPHPLTLLRLAL